MVRWTKCESNICGIVRSVEKESYKSIILRLGFLFTSCEFKFRFSKLHKFRATQMVTFEMEIPNGSTSFCTYPNHSTEFNYVFIELPLKSVPYYGERCHFFLHLNEIPITCISWLI